MAVLVLGLVSCKAEDTVETDETGGTAIEETDTTTESGSTDDGSTESTSDTSGGTSATTTTTISPTSTSTSTTGTTTIKTTAAGLLVNTGGGVSLYNLSNGHGTIGDTASEAKRVAMTFPISSLEGKTVTAATLDIYYESSAGAGVISNLGVAQVLKIPGSSLLTTTMYNSSGLYPTTLVDSDASLSSLTKKDRIRVNILDKVSLAKASGESHLVLRVQMASENSAGNNAITFYMDTSNAVLDAYIPRIRVNWSN